MAGGDSPSLAMYVSDEGFYPEQSPKALREAHNPSGNRENGLHSPGEFLPGQLLTAYLSLHSCAQVFLGEDLNGSWLAYKVNKKLS